MDISQHSLKKAGIKMLTWLLSLGVCSSFAVAQPASTSITSVTSNSVISPTQLYNSHLAQSENNYRALSSKCTEGDAAVCKSLGHAFIKQYHKNHDVNLINQGFSYFERGCSLRDNESCYLRGLTVIEAQQHGLDAGILFRLQDVEAMVIDSLLAGTKLKNRVQASDAFAYLSEIYQDKDRHKTVTYARQGCELNNNDACYLMAISLWLMQVEGNDITPYLDGREADDVIIPAFKKGTQANRLDYCSNSYYFLGYEYARKQMYDSSTEAYKRGCELNNDNACFFTGIAYEDGLGVAKNIQQAYSYYNRSCKFGNAYGCERVRKLQLQGIR